MIRMSTTSGSARKEESTNASRKSPGAPSPIAKPSIHADARLSKISVCFRLECEDVIIADGSVAHGRARESSGRRWPALVGLAAMLAALAAAIVYARHDLGLSHYDGRAHLVVARRVIDSLTPGWRQIGAVWLPLPHLLNLIPVQWDWAYRTGATAIAISVACMGVSAFASARLLLRATGSYMAGAVTAALLVTNVNLLYLHATPMTEPLLVALAFLSIERLDAWLRDPHMSSVTPGVSLLLLCLTRYEG